jgi:hypothetical protein
MSNSREIVYSLQLSRLSIDVPGTVYVSQDILRRRYPRYFLVRYGPMDNSILRGVSGANANSVSAEYAVAFDKSTASTPDPSLAQVPRTRGGASTSVGPLSIDMTSTISGNASGFVPLIMGRTLSLAWREC